MSEEVKKQFSDAVIQAANMISKSINKVAENLLFTSTTRLEEMKREGLIQDYKFENEQLFIIPVKIPERIVIDFIVNKSGAQI